MHGRLRLRAAMAAALGCRFVAFDLDGLAVLQPSPRRLTPPCRKLGTRATCFSSPAVASASSARARMGATAEELTAAAAPVIAIVFMKLRRDMVSCAIKSPPLSFLFLCRFSPAPKWSGLSPDSAEGWRCALRPLPPRPRRFPRDADRTVPYGRHSTEARIVPLHRRLMIWDYYSEGRGSYEPF